MFTLEPGFKGYDRRDNWSGVAASKTKGRFGTPLKLKRNENLHKKPCEATFTEGGKPGSDMRFCARLKCLLVTMFHLPSLDAR